LRDLYFGNYTHLLYLRQLPTQNEAARAKDAAARLGLAYRQVDTGLATLEERLIALVAHHPATKPYPNGAESTVPCAASHSEQRMDVTIVQPISSPKASGV